MVISIDRRGSSAWLRAVELVRARYHESFNANVLPSPDYFISLCQGTGPGRPEPDIHACVGLTTASGGRFFSEQYLDQPIDQIVSARSGVGCSRDEVAEIGSLASSSRSAGLELVRFLPVVTWCHGKRFVLVTVTTQLEALLRRVGIAFQPLADASLSRLDRPEQESWGSYYADNPKTGYINVADALTIGQCYSFANLAFDATEVTERARAVS